MTYQFPARGDLPPVKLTWYEGVRAPRPLELEDGRRMGHAEGGALFKGTKGKLVGGVYGEDPRLIPESRMKEYKLPAKTIPRVEGSHEQDWVRACKAGKRPARTSSIPACSRKSACSATSPSGWTPGSSGTAPT